MFLHTEPPGRELALSVLAEPNYSRAFGNDLRHAPDEKKPLLAPLGNQLTDPGRPLHVKSKVAALSEVVKSPASVFL